MSLDDGRPIHPREFTRAFGDLVAGTGLPRIRLHDVRHSFATVAMESKVEPRLVSDILGHATTAVTLDIYSHPGYDSHRAAIADVLREMGLG